jgi:hypothetical protein
LFGGRKEDSQPVRESPAEPTPATEEAPLDAGAALSKIKKALNDFGLEDEDIIEAVKAAEYNEDRINEGVAFEYILAYYDVIFNDEIADLAKHRYSVVYDLLRNSKFGFHQDWKFDDEDLLEVNLRPPLALFDVEVDFSPHAAGERFTITIKKDGETHSNEYIPSGPGCDMEGKMKVLNLLLGNIYLHFIKMKTGGDHHDYFLIVFERNHVLKQYYGKEYEKFVTEGAMPDGTI